MPRLQEMYARRDQMITDIMVGLQTALYSPEMQNFSAAQTRELWASFRLLLDGWEAMVKATSGSNKGYEIKDLPVDIFQYHFKARHLLNVLDLLVNGKVHNENEA